jgi:integrase
MDIRLHDIRRTFGSYQAIAGASLQVIGKSLGHKSQQSTQVYARLHNDPIRASVNSATATMLSLGKMHK